MTDTVCAAFWKHTNIRSDNRVFPCCRYKTPVTSFDGDIQKILALPIYDKLRSDSLAGIKNPNCAKCYYEDSVGKRSARQHFNDNWAIDQIKLEYLEIGFDNICNLTCDGCRGEFSSAWANIESPNVPAKLNIKSINHIESIPQSIKRVSFLGGEPLMTSRHIELLEMIDDKSKVTIVYNTNGTFLLSDIAIEQLNQFGQVEFILSIDGVGPLNEQVRSGSNWESILKFIKQIKSLGYLLMVNTVVHINNWHGLVELYKFLSEQQLHWRVNVLTYPPNLDIINLNTTDKQHLIDILDNIHIPDKDKMYDVISIKRHLEHHI